MWMLAGLYEFEVQKVWKGDAKLKNIKVWASATYHGYSAYQKGESYIVYVQYIRGYPTTSPGMCGPDHVYSESTMRTLLAEYEQAIQAMQTNTMDVKLALENNGEGVLTLSNPNEPWKGIAHPEEHPNSLSIIVKDDTGKRVYPATTFLGWSLKTKMDLSKEEPFSVPVSVLKYLQGNRVMKHELTEGTTYRVKAVYTPLGLDLYRFESNEVEIQYTKSEKPD